MIKFRTLLSPEITIYRTGQDGVQMAMKAKYKKQNIRLEDGPENRN
jgi:hypothetical protein